MDKKIQTLCDIVRQTSYAVHLYHKPGYYENIYENSLCNRLRKSGVNIRQQYPIPVFDEDGTLLGDYKADVIVEDCLLLELKVVKALVQEHFSQILGYLKASRIEHGLLINFGSPKFEIRKFIYTQDQDFETDMSISPEIETQIETEIESDHIEHKELKEKHGE